MFNSSRSINKILMKETIDRNTEQTLIRSLIFPQPRGTRKETEVKSTFDKGHLLSGDAHPAVLFSISIESALRYLERSRIDLPSRGPSIQVDRLTNR